MARINDFQGSEVESCLANIRRRSLYASARWQHSIKSEIVTTFVDQPQENNQRRLGWTGCRGSLNLEATKDLSDAESYVPRDEIPEKDHIILESLGL